MHQIKGDGGWRYNERRRRVGAKIDGKTDRADRRIDKVVNSIFFKVLVGVCLPGMEKVLLKQMWYFFKQFKVA